MNRFLATLSLALAVTAGTAVAQTAAPMPAHHHARNPHKAALRMGQRLNLSPEQTGRVEPILANRQQKVQALRADTSLTDGQRHQQIKAIHRDTRMQMRAVLTPAQMKQWKALRHDHARAANPPAGV